MDAVLVAALIVLALVAWAIVSTLRADARAALTVQPTSEDHATSARPEPIPKSPSEAPPVPSLVEDDDIIEITVVEAAPLTEPPPRDNVETKTAGTVVEVMYEDEADTEELTMPVARILVSAYGNTDVGKLRRRNEDSLLVFPERSVFCVADGMGGYAGGNIASALAVETLRASFDNGHFDAKTLAKTEVPRRGRELACAIQMANQAVYAKAQSDPALEQMGTTMVAARFSPNKQRVYIGHVGDSRCYRLRQTTLRQLTRDHTMAELMGLHGPGAQHLFQAVGIRSNIFIDLVVDKPRVNDLYLLCSDGLSKMVKDDQIRDALLADSNVDSCVRTLIDLANAHGGRDNTTVILVKVVEPAPLLEASPAPGRMAKN